VVLVSLGSWIRPPDLWLRKGNRNSHKSPVGTTHSGKLSTSSISTVAATGGGGEEANSDAIDIDHLTSHSLENRGEDEFEQVIWPRLTQKLCPNGVPDVSLGTSLFEMGRIEFGLDANATAAHSNIKAARSNRQKISNYFYDGGFGYTMFIDAIDPTNTLIYAPIWKCANNQIHDYLNRVFNRNKDGTIRKKSVAIGNRGDMYLEKLKISDLEYMFFEVLERSKSTDEGNHKDAFFTFNNTARSKPCVFAVLRDPISHFLSGYNEVEYRLLSGAHDAAEALDNTHKLASYTKIPFDEGPEKRENRFKTFVRNLLKEHPSFASFYFYKHFASMSRILPTLSRFDLLPEQEGASSSWFLPTIDNLTETFPKFLEDRCPRMAFNYKQQEEQAQNQQASNIINKNNSNNTLRESHLLPPMKRLGGHESSKDGYGTYQAAKNVWHTGGPTARALCALHAMDYACFGDGLGFPPRVCRDVYSSKHFVNRLLGDSPSE
jgi:hypothetical protein